MNSRAVEVDQLEHLLSLTGKILCVPSLALCKLEIEPHTSDPRTGEPDGVVWKQSTRTSQAEE